MTDTQWCSWRMALCGGAVKAVEWPGRTVRLANDDVAGIVNHWESEQRPVFLVELPHRPGRPTSFLTVRPDEMVPLDALDE